MAKETTKGEELSALGKQTMAHAYSAMDYYFDHLKKTIASVPSGGTEFGEKVKAYAEKSYARIRSGPELRQGYPGCGTNSDGIHARSVGSIGEHAKDLGEAYIKAVSGQTSKPRP